VAHEESTASLASAETRAKTIATKAAREKAPAPCFTIRPLVRMVRALGTYNPTNPCLDGHEACVKNLLKRGAAC